MSSEGKRKRRKEADLSSSKVRINVNEVNPDSAGPSFAAFTTQDPPPSTEFRIYKNAANSTILAGETEKLEFESRHPSPSEITSNYMLAHFSPSSSTLEAVPTPLYLMIRKVKALKDLPPINPFNPSAYAQARATLGNAFGTKKSQKAIRAAQRNKIDPSTMSHIREHLASTITTNSAALPTEEDIAAVANATRPIPPPNLDATQPKEVYDLDTIIPPEELAAIPMDIILSAETAKAAQTMLPFRRSRWIFSRLSATWNAYPTGRLPKKEQKKLRLLVYISFLLAAKGAKSWSRGSLQKRLTPRPVIFKKAEKVRDEGAGQTEDEEEKDALQLESIGEDVEVSEESTAVPPYQCPSIIVEGLLARFTETAQGSLKPIMTSHSKLKLLTYLGALCLVYTDFCCPFSSLPQDLQMDDRELGEVFKSLGCKVIKLTTGDLQSQQNEQPHNPTESRRQATLTVPLKFPERRRVRRN